LKLVITAFSTMILMIYMGTFRQMAGVAADPVVELGLVRNSSPLLHAILALVLLLAATVLAIYKPFGMTPFGAREQGQARLPAQSASALIRLAIASKRRRWEYVFWIAALIVLGLIVVSHLMGPSSHGH
jgi:hypothetical protein